MVAAGFGDGGLQTLARHGRLRALALIGAAAVTDEGLAALAESQPGLSSLDFSAARGITDSSLDALALGCRALTSLCLGSSTEIGDEGLAALGGLAMLRYLDLSSARHITREAAERFKAERPRGQFIFPAGLDASEPVPLPEYTPSENEIF